jgi:hypothetical protein
MVNGRWQNARLDVLMNLGDTPKAAPAPHRAQIDIIDIDAWFAEQRSRR